MAVDKIISREANYRTGIRQNHAQCIVVADRMAIGGDIEKVMLQAAGDDDTQHAEIVAFLEEQRTRLKKLAEKNVESNRSVDAFLGALSDVRTEIVARNDQNAMEGGEAEEKNDDDLPDYEKVISQKMKQHAQTNRREQLNMEDEAYCREIRDRLGEKSKSKKKKKRKSRGDDDDDDDIEMLPPTQGATSQSTKCPITGMYFQDPVKSKTCGHTYSLAGIQQCIGMGRSTKCPVPGCSNTQVTMDNVEKDLEMEFRVKQQLRRDERENKQRQSQFADDEDDFEEAEAVL